MKPLSDKRFIYVFWLLFRSLTRTCFISQGSRQHYRGTSVTPEGRGQGSGGSRRVQMGPDVFKRSQMGLKAILRGLNKGEGSF